MWVGGRSERRGMAVEALVDLQPSVYLNLKRTNPSRRWWVKGSVCQQCRTHVAHFLRLWRAIC